MPLLNNETLEAKCLDVIASNFDLFLAAFSSKEKFSIYIPVIQKRWTCHLLWRLCGRSLMKNEHLQFLLNQYLQELDVTSIFTSCDPEMILSRLNEIGHVIEKIYLRSLFTFDFENIWSYFPNVHTIDLQYSSCFNESLFFMAQSCPHLKTLNLFGCIGVDNNGMMILVESGLRLERLDLQKTSVKYAGVCNVLKGIPSLKYLWHDLVPQVIFEISKFSDSSGKVKRVFNLKNLTVIISANDSNHETLSSHLEKYRTVCPYLTELLVNHIYSESDLALCSSFSELRRVNFHFLPHGLSVNDFLKLRGDKIQTLSLKFASLSLEILLNNCPNLQNLTLNCPYFEDTSFNSSKSNFTHLKCINLYNDCAFPDENAQSIANLISLCPNLENLRMERCKLNCEVIDVILNHTKCLKRLHFDLISVQASILEEIIKFHKNLELLQICNCGITGEEYNDLMKIRAGLKHKVDIIWHELISSELSFLIEVHAEYEKFFRESISGKKFYSYTKIKWELDTRTHALTRGVSFNELRDLSDDLVIFR